MKKPLESLQLEIDKALTGDSFYSPQDLAQAIDTVKGTIQTAETEIHNIQDEVTQKKAAVENLTQ